MVLQRWHYSTLLFDIPRLGVSPASFAHVGRGVGEGGNLAGDVFQWGFLS
jgi:hypothetical protein